MVTDLVPYRRRVPRLVRRMMRKERGRVIYKRPVMADLNVAAVSLEP